MSKISRRSTELREEGGNKNQERMGIAPRGLWGGLWPNAAL